MFLRSLFRAVARRWTLAASIAASIFLAGLFFIPRPLSFSAQARLQPLGDRWSPGRIQGFAQSDAVLDQAAKSLGYDSGSELRPGLSVRTAKEGVLLSATASTPSRAIERVNAVGKAVESLSSTARRMENDASMQRVDEAILSRRKELARILAPLASPESAADRTAREQVDAIERALETELAEVVAISASIDLLSFRIERSDAGPSRPVNTAESDRVGAELDLARRQWEDLRATYPEDWPPVARAAARVEELRSRRAVTANREILEARFAPLREAIEEIRELAAKRDRIQAGVPSREAQLRAFRARPASSTPPPEEGLVQQIRVRQEAMTASIRELEALRTRLSLDRAGGDSVIERFESAGSAPLSGAPLPLLLGISLLLGLAAAVLAESLASTIRTEHDIRRYINLPLLAIVPHEKTLAKRVLPAAGSAITEAFNTLAALLETRTREDGSRLFAVTSSVPAEGKSTVACNVAVALARAGSRVLLVDADLRRGTQHRLFSVAQEPGLSSYLQGGTDTVDSMVVATDIDNLTLMPSGAPMQNPIPFLHAERFHALLRDLRGWYEYVILDLPPVKSAADALIVAPLADALVLVAAASETRKDDVTYAKRMIRSVKAKLCGCVLTKARIRAGGYYYYPAAVQADAAE